MSPAVASHDEVASYAVEVEELWNLERQQIPIDRALGGVQTRNGVQASARVLLIDDDASQISEGLRQQLPPLSYHVLAVETIAQALRLVRHVTPDVIVLGWTVTNVPGGEIYQQIRQINPRIPIIAITGGGRADTAIEATQCGAYDCLFKPLDLSQLRDVIGEALDVAGQMRSAVGITRSLAEVESDDAIVGNCPAMREVYKAIGRVTHQDVTVLITGESGTGKELVARAIYRHSHRANGPFLALNCAAIPEQLLESELFGHEKGAFTGADRRRIGKFEQCHGGTIFLDEIGDMPQSIQAKMLRILQEQSFQRVGGNETIHTDVRVITATHHDLKQDAAEGKFRSDLYYRLDGFRIHLPPLRERGDDLAVLARYYLHRCSRELGREVHEISQEAVECLYRHAWPGNIRELKSVLKQALLRAQGTVLVPAFLPPLEGTPRAGNSVSAVESDSSAVESESNLELLLERSRSTDQSDLYADAHRQLDRLLLARVLNDSRGNQHQAALRLGIARETLRRRLRELGLHVTRQTHLLERV